MQSKPGPIFAMEAGTFIRTSRSGGPHPPPSGDPHAVGAGSPAGMGKSHWPTLWGGPCFSQLQDLSECAGVSVQFDGRFHIFQRRLRVFEAGTGQDDDRDGVAVDLAIADEAE